MREHIVFNGQNNLSPTEENTSYMKDGMPLPGKIICGNA
jgi:hypothetical protein